MNRGLAGPGITIPCMKTPSSSLTQLALATCLGAGAIVSTGSAHGATLTAVAAFSADADGNAAGSQVWDTFGPGFFWNLWVSPGAPQGSPDGLSSPLLNGPTDAQAVLVYPLRAGRNRFTVFGQPGLDASFRDIGLNLFLDGHELPGISARAPVRRDQTLPPFIANSASSTYGAWQNSVPGAGVLKFETPTEIVELSEFYWAAPGVFATDRVSGTSTEPGGGADFVGSFTLVVRPNVQALAIRVSEVEITFGTRLGVRYQVEYTVQLTGESWQPLGEPIVGTGDTALVRDPVPADEPRRWYRVVQLD